MGIGVGPSTAQHNIYDKEQLLHANFIKSFCEDVNTINREILALAGSYAVLFDAIYHEDKDRNVFMPLFFAKETALITTCISMRSRISQAFDDFVFIWMQVFQGKANNLISKAYINNSYFLLRQCSGYGYEDAKYDCDISFVLLSNVARILCNYPKRFTTVHDIVSTFSSPDRNLENIRKSINARIDHTFSLISKDHKEGRMKFTVDLVDCIHRFYFSMCRKVNIGEGLIENKMPVLPVSIRVIEETILNGNLESFAKVFINCCLVFSDQHKEKVSEFIDEWLVMMTSGATDPDNSFPHKK